jgi:hypothetical protein
VEVGKQVGRAKGVALTNKAQGHSVRRPFFLQKGRSPGRESSKQTAKAEDQAAFDLRGFSIGRVP